MVMLIYGDSENFRTQKVLVAAKLASKEVLVKKEAPPMGDFPIGLTPALVDGSQKIFGAECCMKYLLGKDTKYHPQAIELDQWLYWASGQLLPNLLAHVLNCVSAAQIDPKTMEQIRAELFAQLAALNRALLGRTFLVGERLSLADISLALDLVPAYQYVLGDDARSRIPNINRWFTTVLNQHGVRDLLAVTMLQPGAQGQQVPKFISEPKQFDEATYKKLAGLSLKDQDQQQKQSSAKKEKEPAKPQQQKPKKEGNEAEEMDATDEALAAQPKFVDPFAEMPPGTRFSMDAFKRVYSNEDTATKAIPHFWENFDPENYSIWFAEYKYPEELRAVFMSCNLITGMFQRLEKMKKHAFGSVCLFGGDSSSTISGVWIWRGHKLAFELCPDWQVDYESYDWKKLDPDDEKVRKLVNEYFLWEGDFGGNQFNQGKIFK